MSIHEYKLCPGARLFCASHSVSPVLLLPLQARDTYRLTCGADNMNRELIMKFIEAQTLLLGPITPHLCEHIWGNLLKKEGCLVRAGMPKMNMTKEHFNLQMAGRYLQVRNASLRVSVRIESVTMSTAKLVNITI